MDSVETVIAVWQTKGDQRYLRLTRHDYPDGVPAYDYTSESGGGCLPKMENDQKAIDWMEKPWDEYGAGPVTVMRDDFPSTRRVL